jgi:hypothetical protein
VVQIHVVVHVAHLSLSGSSGIGELIANTLAVRSIAVVVLDLKPIETQNCERLVLLGTGGSGTHVI